MTIRPIALAAVSAVLVLAACGSAALPSRTPSPSTGLPAACAATPAYRPAPADRPRYVLDLVIRPDDALVEGHQRVTFTPDLATDRLVFRLWPNSPPAAAAGTRLTVSAATIAGTQITTPADASLDNSTTFVVRPARSFAAGETIAVELSWSLSLPGPVLDRISRNGNEVRLGSFFPILAWEPGRGWATDPPAGILGEASTSPVADFELRVDVPDGLEVVATGTEQSPGQWAAVAVRDVAVAVGRFRTASTTVAGSPPVSVRVAVAEALATDPAPFLERAARAIRQLAQRFGPYPYPGQMPHDPGHPPPSAT